MFLCILNEEWTIENKPDHHEKCKWFVGNDENHKYRGLWSMPLPQLTRPSCEFGQKLNRGSPGAIWWEIVQSIQFEKRGKYIWAFCGIVFTLVHVSGSPELETPPAHLDTDVESLRQGRDLVEQQVKVRGELVEPTLAGWTPSAGVQVPIVAPASRDLRPLIKKASSSLPAVRLAVSGATCKDHQTFPNYLHYPLVFILSLIKIKINLTFLLSSSNAIWQ